MKWLPWNSLAGKLALASLLVALSAVAFVVLFIRYTSVERLNRLVVEQQRSNFANALVDYYAANDTWEGVQNYQSYFFPGHASQPFNQANPGANFPRVRFRIFGLIDTQGKVIIPLPNGAQAGQLVSAQQLKAGMPVEVDGVQVGFILTEQLPPELSREERQFLQRTNEALLLATLGAAAVALLTGIYLARTLARPLQGLTLAAQKIAQGDLEQQVPVTSQDELGRLAEAFNQMSQEVARANHLRRQMTADIAHDLRTPLTVVGGYIESMRDGVLQPTHERLALIYTEIERLQHMVSDLRMLSQADAGELSMHLQPIAPAALLEQAARRYQHQAEQIQVSLKLETPKDLPVVSVDEARMMQVLDNLLSNALRFTPTGGQISLSASKNQGTVQIVVTDTGSGIPTEDLPNIFTRFYRADQTRSGDSGESGLGLSIAKALVTAHGGEIRAESEPGEGTRVTISLPVADMARIQT